MFKQQVNIRNHQCERCATQYKCDNKTGCNNIYCMVAKFHEKDVDRRMKSLKPRKATLYGGITVQK